MNDINDMEQKLSKLREDYKVKLPDKLKELEMLWQQLQDDPGLDNFTVFYRKIHSLHGTANTYGYTELGQLAGQLEAISKVLAEKPNELKNNKNKVNQLLSDLKTVNQRETEQIKISSGIVPNADSATVIYLLEDDRECEANIVPQLSSFGYQVKTFNEVEYFIEALQHKTSAILIINIDLVNAALEQNLIERNKNAQNDKCPTIFLSTSGDFELRLKAVRLGGEAFLIKPFLVEELVNTLDQLLKAEKATSRILIVDDELEVASYNAAILEQANMKTLVVTKSSEVDKALHEFNPDLILMDLVMPDCSGVELAKIIRQQSLYHSTPIIYLSAEEDQLNQLNAMKLGADDFLTKSIKPVYLVMTIRNRVERYKKLTSMMVKDNLTGLYNHSFIQNQLEIEFKESMLLHNPLSIALINLDKLRSINSTYGHQAGDNVLRSLGLLLRRRLRANDLVGRYEDKNFLVILPNTSLEAAKTLIDDIRKQFLTLNYSWNQQIFNASFSASIASFPDYHTPVELIDAATDALAKLKRSGRNRIEVAG